MPSQVEQLRIPVDRRSDALLTVSRSGDLYGCVLQLYVKVTAAGRVYRVPDASGRTLVEFVEPTASRSLPAAELQRGERVAIDVIVTVKQPSAACGKVRLEASLELPGFERSTVADALELVAGETAGVLDVGWGVSG